MLARKQRLSLVPATLFSVLVFPVRVVLISLSVLVGVLGLLVTLPATFLLKWGHGRIAKPLFAIGSGLLQPIAMVLWGQAWLLGGSFGEAATPGISLTNWQHKIRRHIPWQNVKTISEKFHPRKTIRRIELISGDAIDVDVLDPAEFDTVADRCGHPIEARAQTRPPDQFQLARERTVRALLGGLPPDREITWLIVGAFFKSSDSRETHSPQSGGASMGAALLRHMINERLKVAFAISMQPNPLVCLKGWNAGDVEPSWPQGHQWTVVHTHEYPEEMGSPFSRRCQ